MTALKVTWFDGERSVGLTGKAELLKIEREIRCLNVPGAEFTLAEVSYTSMRGFGVLRKRENTVPDLTIYHAFKGAEWYFGLAGTLLLNEREPDTLTDRLLTRHVDVRVVPIHREDGDFEAYVTFTDGQQRNEFELVVSKDEAHEAFDRKARYGLMVTRWRDEK